MSGPTYFWSGSNRAGEIQALACHNQPIGVGMNDLEVGGMAALLALAERHRFVIGVTRERTGRPILIMT